MPQCSAARNTSVSGAASKKDFKKLADHEAVFPSSYRTDVRLEKREADHLVVLPRLDEAAMTTAWRDLKLQAARYNMVKQNCSTIVAALLEIGSGITPPVAPTIHINEHLTGNRLMALSMRFRFFGNTIAMWSPNEVHRYAVHIKTRIPVCS